MQDIICLSMTTWEGDYMKTIVHMMGQLAKNHRVLFVDYPFTLKDVGMTLVGKSKAPVKRMLGIKPRLRELTVGEETVYHLTLPPVIPINWIADGDTFKKASQLQATVIKRSIRSAMKQLEMKHPVVINAFNPIIGLPLVGAFEESKLIYYCYDEIRAAQWCGKHGGMMEDEFIEKADQVIVTSENLLEVKSQKNPNTFLVKNGVDFDLFNQGYNAMRFQKEQKVIGYVGSIDFRLDYDLLEHIIRRNPSYQFHFVGRITDCAGKDRLNAFENVVFFGSQQPNDIPKYMIRFDLGLIPFVKNDFTKNIYPLKINEYLAAGLPVVSTRFASLSDFEQHIAIAENESDFLNKMDLEILDDTFQKAKKRIGIALKNDWSERAQQVEKLLNPNLHHVA